MPFRHQFAAAAALTLPVLCSAQVAEYNFQNTFVSDIIGAPALTVTNPLSASGFESAVVNGSPRTVWRFTTPIGQTTESGLTFNSTNLLPFDSWACELVFSFGSATGWRRVLDLTNRAADQGVYISNLNRLALVPLSAATAGPFTAGDFHHVVVSVNGPGTGGASAVRGYLDGTEQFSFTTTALNIPAAATRPIHLFLDDADNEFSNGRIALARFYAAPLSPAEVTALAAPWLTIECPADVGATGGSPGHDSILDNNDFVVFIDYFFSQNPLADRGTTGGVPGHDSLYNNNDFIVFIDQFFQGC